MNGAIFYATKHGSTAEYAKWIGEATDLPVFSVTDPKAHPSQYDFLVLGSPIFYYKLLIQKWLREHAEQVRAKPTVLFSVSGAGAGVKLDGWLADSMSDSLISSMEHFALRGRWRPAQLSRLERTMLVLAGLFNRDPQARKEEMEGFDYVDQATIAPIVERVLELQRTPTTV